MLARGAIMPSLKSPRLNNLTSYVEIWIRPIAFYFVKKPLSTQLQNNIGAYGLDFYYNYIKWVTS